MTVTSAPRNAPAPPDLTIEEAPAQDRAAALGAAVHDALSAAGVDAVLDCRSLLTPGAGPSVRRTAGAGGPVIALRVTSDGVLVCRADLQPCPTCLDRRWVLVRGEAERRVFDQPFGVLQTRASGWLPTTLDQVVAVVTRAATDPGDGTGTPLTTPVWQIRTDSPGVSRWSLMADSSCPECSQVPDDGPSAARIRLEPAPVASPGDARSLSPFEIGLPLDALANPVCGVLGPPALRAYQATASAPVTGHFRIRSKYGLHDMWWSGHAETYAKSELLALLEGLERLAGQAPTARRTSLHATRFELPGPSVEMETCGTYTPEFYAHHSATYVPWADNPSIPWVWGWSLRDDRAIAVPEQLVYYLDRRRNHRNTVQECSNGCASGTSLTEATLHGLLELLERDAFLTSWHVPLTPPEVDLDTVRSPLVQYMRGELDRLGYDLRCFDTRTDIPVPTIGAVAVRRDGGLGTLCFAGGAGLDPTSAVAAAVSEVASYVPGFEDRVSSNLALVEAAIEDYRHIRELEHHALLYGHPDMADKADHWLRQQTVTPVDELYADWSSVYTPTTDLRDAVRLLVRLFSDRGMDTVVTEQTSPEQHAMGVRTVSTLVPGLVPIDFGWERQRVLHLPRTLWAHHRAGLSTAPFSTADLVQAPHPFP